MAGRSTFTVNAVDSKWNVVQTINDTVAITSSDTTATLPVSAALAGGTGQYSITFTATGNPTVTATDTTAGNVAAGTSAALSVTP